MTPMSPTSSTCISSQAFTFTLQLIPTSLKCIYIHPPTNPNLIKFNNGITRSLDDMYAPIRIKISYNFKKKIEIIRLCEFRLFHVSNDMENATY